MDLQSGSVTQLTNTPEYDGAPVWSPDMAWMAYETYTDGQLDIAIQSMTDTLTLPVLLTEDPGSDHSPAWAPDGRRIAFVSSRTGDADVWLADLDKTSEQFINLSATAPRGGEPSQLEPGWFAPSMGCQDETAPATRASTSGMRRGVGFLPSGQAAGSGRPGVQMGLRWLSCWTRRPSS